MSLTQKEYVAGLAFDLETTGLDVRTNEIVQIAVVIANSERGKQYSSLVLPSGPIPQEASNVHGFTREVLLEHGARPFPEVWAECEEWLHETLASETRPVVWAAHNGNRFDVPILRRCVHEATGGESSLLSHPRATFVDTLVMARSAMPKRARELPPSARPYTLGSLYESASGSALDGAHDALVDTEALARVWRWLVEDKGAEGHSTQWAAGAKGDLSPFQAHLQYHGYPQAAKAATPSQQARATQQAAGKSASRAIRASSVDLGSVGGSKRRAAPDGGVGSDITRVPGVGDYLAKRLSSKGIATYDELRDVWHERGSSKAMLGWLKKSLPGINSMVVARAVKGMGEEFGTPD